MTGKAENIKDKINVSYVANLARIDLTEEEKSLFGRQLEDVVEYFKKLSGLDISGIEPTAHATPLTNVLRHDVPGDSIKREQMLKNAPMHDDSQIIVPKILA